MLKKINTFLLILTFFISTASCQKDKDKTNTLPVHLTALTQRLVDSSGIIPTVFSDTSFTVTDGVEETDIHYLSQEGLTTRMFILKVDLNNSSVKLQVATPYDAPDYAAQSVSDMAKYVDESGHRVVAGVNGDFFNTSSFVPMGIVYKDGVAIKPNFTDNSDKPQQGLSFLTILNDGRAVIGTKDELDDLRSSIKEATGGGVLLVDNYKAQPQSIPTMAPRTAVGVADNNQVYFMEVDGRDFDYSNGINYEELSKFMQAIGVKRAINLDGGGSSTFMIRNPLANVWQYRNKPSDGSPRAISNAWLVISNQP